MRDVLKSYWSQWPKETKRTSVKGVLMMNVSEAISKRKSVRAYEDKPIPVDVLKKII